jgi:hypothetical protein
MYAAEVTMVGLVVVLLCGELHDLACVCGCCACDVLVLISFGAVIFRALGKCPCFDPSVAAATTRCAKACCLLSHLTSSAIDIEHYIFAAITRLLFSLSVRQV